MVRRSTGTTNLREARRFENRLKSSLNREGYTWDQVVDAYLIHKPSERAAYACKAMHDFFVGRLVTEITQPLVVAYSQSRGVGASTIRRELTVLRAAINYCKRELGYEVEVRFKLPRVDERRVRWLNREEYERLLEAAHNSKSVYLAPFIELAVATGARRGELLGLTWDRVDLERRLIYLEPHHQKIKDTEHSVK